MQELIALENLTIKLYKKLDVNAQADILYHYSIYFEEAYLCLKRYGSLKGFWNLIFGIII